MRILYAPTFADYWALNVHVLRRQFRTITLVAAVLLILFFLVPLMPNTVREGSSLLEVYRASLGLLILPGIVIFGFVATFWGAKKRWTAAQELREEREYEFGDEGVRVKTKSTEGFTEWKIFKEAVVTKRFVFLTTAQRQYHYFPVSVVPDVPRLRELLTAKLACVKNA